MIGKKQLKIISVVLAAFLLLAAFMAGILGLTDDLGALKEQKSDYNDFSSMLSSMAELDGLVNEGKSDYDSRKAAYDSALKQYNDELSAFNESETEFNSDVLDYNRKIVEYKVGKDAMSSGEAAYKEGKSQLDAGWKAYKDGRAAFDAGKAEADKQLAVFEKGKEAYEQGLKQYEDGLAAYNQLMTAISDMEKRLVPHRLALLLISTQSGTKITDESIAEMKAGLDAAKVELDKAKAQIDAAESAMPDAQKQMKDAEKQLDDTEKMLKAGEDELNKAKEQIDSGKAQIDAIGSEVSSGQDKLDERSAGIEKTRAELEDKKAELDTEKDELSVYESYVQKLSRRREMLIDSGYGTAADTNEALMLAAGEHESELHGDYVKTLVSFVVSYSAQLLAVAVCVAALATLKKRFVLSRKLSVIAVALGAVSIIAAIVFGSVHSLAFAAAVFTALGIGLTEQEAE